MRERASECVGRLYSRNSPHARTLWRLHSAGAKVRASSSAIRCPLGSANSSWLNSSSSSARLLDLDAGVAQRARVVAKLRADEGQQRPVLRPRVQPDRDAAVRQCDVGMLELVADRNGPKTERAIELEPARERLRGERELEELSEHAALRRRWESCHNSVRLSRRASRARVELFEHRPQSPCSSVIFEVAAVLLPVFCIAALGLFWRRTGAAFDLDFVTRLIMNIAGPCLVFENLARLVLPLEDFFAMVGAAIAIMVVTALAAFALLKTLRLPIRSYLPALTIGNVGNLGLPLCLFAFGEQGLALGVALYVTNSVGQFTLVPLLQARTSFARTLATTPVLYAAVGRHGRETRQRRFAELARRYAASPRWPHDSTDAARSRAYRGRLTRDELEARLRARLRATR